MTAAYGAIREEQKFQHTTIIMPPQSSSMSCPECQGTDIDFNEASGEAVCVFCGTVLEENTIVSSIEFQESGSGAASVIGQYVSSSSTGGYGAVHGGTGRHYSKESREATLAQGKRKIQYLASLLRLGNHYVESAHRLFMMAVQRNFTTGRKSHNVIAACLYVVCRREKSPHLLIDFSDKLQTNVYVLGSVYLKFCRLLNLVLPIIDPSLYIHRFAAQLKLGDKTHAVATAALRLVATMKRDWLETGRRPSGICGAALLIAAQAHDVEHVSRAEILNVVNVSDYTLCSRLKEFALTPSGQLSLEHFNSMNWTSASNVACDPPAFRRNQAQKVLLSEQLLERLSETDPNEKRISTNYLISDTQLSQKLVEKKGGLCSNDKTLALEDSSSHDCSSGNQDYDVVEHAVAQSAQAMISGLRESAQKHVQKRQATEALYASIAADLKHSIEQDFRKNSTGPSPEMIDLSEIRCHRTTNAIGFQEQPRQLSPTTFQWTETLTGSGALVESNVPVAEVEEPEEEVVDDEEIEGLLLNETEVEQKTILWTKMNAQYLREEKEKAEYEAIHGKPITKKRKKKQTVAVSPSESAMVKSPALLDQAYTTVKNNKRMSRNINYEVLENLFGPEND